VKSSQILLFLIACASVAAAPAWALAQDIDEERPPGLGEDDGGGAGYAFGDEAAPPEEPLRVLGMLGGGISLRIVNDLDYGQERFGPAFIDGWGGVVLPGAGTWRHGLGAQLSLNVTGDGNATLGVDAASQLVVGPSYLAYLRFDDLVIFPKVTIPIAVTSGLSVGLELSVGGAYYLLAGLGIYAELGASLFWGQQDRIHPIASGEAGILIDYEVLP
jgi:hypothetical protein